MSAKFVTIHAAKTHLSQLIVRACDGEEIIISRGHEPVARLVALKTKSQVRRFGALRGKAKVGAAFFDPLPSEELDRWDT